MDCHPCRKNKTVKASIDIGTNTVLLLIARCNANKLEILHQEQRMPRLGQGVDREGNLADKAMERVVEALKEFKKIIANDYPEVSEPVVTATSAVRDAENGEDFVEQIMKKTGLSVQILSGLEEAQYTFYGAQSVLPVGNEPVAVLDIGGGSTELAYGSKSCGLIDRHSFDMGCVRYTERYLSEKLPTDTQLASCRSAIAKMLKQKDFSLADNTVLLGVGGTVTSLVYMELGLDSYNSSRINGYLVTTDLLKKWIIFVKSTKTDELKRAYPDVMEGRADIFLAGLLILEAVMEVYGFNQLVVSTGGIRHGSLMGKMEK